MPSRKVVAGELAIEQEVSKKVEYHRNHIELHEDLTARERDVPQLIAKGYENQRIADELFISLKTVQDPCVQYPSQTWKSAIVPRRLSMPFSTTW